ncbi:MAG: hypothetical protein IJ711_01035 [Lachnospiraceae bacterium]|nr:hypothetical protein [Lachnospiraceae bacterium]
MKKTNAGKKIAACLLAGGLLLTISINSKAYNATYSVGGYTMTCQCTVAGTLGKSKSSSAVGSTGYDGNGTIQTVSVFAYNSSGTLLTNNYSESQVSAITTTTTKKGVTSYKGVHSILDSSRSVIKTVKKTQS